MKKLIIGLFLICLFSATSLYAAPAKKHANKKQSATAISKQECLKNDPALKGKALQKCIKNASKVKKNK